MPQFLKEKIILLLFLCWDRNWAYNSRKSCTQCCMCGNKDYQINFEWRRVKLTPMHSPIATWHVGNLVCVDIGCFISQSCNLWTHFKHLLLYNFSSHFISALKCSLITTPISPQFNHTLPEVLNRHGRHLDHRSRQPRPGTNFLVRNTSILLLLLFMSRVLVYRPNDIITLAVLMYV